MCFPRPTAEAFLRDAEHYTSTLESNWVLMRKSVCTQEFVVEQNTALSYNLHALDFFHLISLEQLLGSVPLKNCSGENHFVQGVQHIQLILDLELWDQVEV